MFEFNRIRIKLIEHRNCVHCFFCCFDDYYSMMVFLRIDNDSNVHDYLYDHHLMQHDMLDTFHAEIKRFPLQQNKIIKQFDKLLQEYFLHRPTEKNFVIKLWFQNMSKVRPFIHFYKPVKIAVLKCRGMIRQKRGISEVSAS